MKKYRLWDRVNKSYTQVTLADIYEQGIGIFDNEGKEIYENDIVRFSPDTTYDSSFIGVIKYSPELGSYIIGSDINPHYRHSLSYGVVAHYSKVCPSLKILGNINQNQNILDDYYASMGEKRVEDQALSELEFAKLSPPYKVKIYGGKDGCKIYKITWNNKKYLITDRYRGVDEERSKYSSCGRVESFEWKPKMNQERNILGINWSICSLVPYSLFCNASWYPNTYRLSGPIEKARENWDRMIDVVRQAL